MPDIDRRKALGLLSGGLFVGVTGCGAGAGAGARAVVNTITTEFVAILGAAVKLLNDSGIWVLVITGVLGDNSTNEIQIKITNPEAISSITVTMKNGTTKEVPVTHE